MRDQGDRPDKICIRETITAVVWKIYGENVKLKSTSKSREYFKIQKKSARGFVSGKILQISPETEPIGYNLQ